MVRINVLLANPTFFPAFHYIMQKRACRKFADYRGFLYVSGFEDLHQTLYMEKLNKNSTLLTRYENIYKTSLVSVKKKNRIIECSGLGERL